MTGFRIAFVVLAAVWALMVPAAPFAASRAASESSFAGSALALVAYGIGRLICHQRPERSFSLFGAQLPVCARCTGIYAGAALTAVVAWWSYPPARRPISLGDSAPCAPDDTPSAFERRSIPPPPDRERRVGNPEAGGAAHPSDAPGNSRRPSARRDADAARRVLLAAIAPTMATLLYEWTTGQTPGQWTRAASGVPVGVAVAWIVCVVAPRQPQPVTGAPE